MNEYYKSRYNLYKFLLNIDTDEYNRYLSIFLPILYIILVLLSLFIIVLIKNSNISIIIYIIFLIILYISSYNIVQNLQSIENNSLLLQYKTYYQLYNCLFKENLRLLSKIPNISKDNVNDILLLKSELLENIHNIENIYGDDAEKLLNSYDISKYYDLDNYIAKGLDYKLYIYDNNIPFIKKDRPFVISRDDILDKLKYIDLKVLYDTNINYTESTILLNYINKKYNTSLSTLYIKPIFTPKFEKSLKELINNLKRNIYYFIIILCYFIVILLQGLLYEYNMLITHIYLGIIIIAFILLYYYN
jgi:hypothetical protein